MLWLPLAQIHVLCTVCGKELMCIACLDLHVLVVVEMQVFQEHSLLDDRTRTDTANDLTLHLQEAQSQDV